MHQCYGNYEICNVLVLLLSYELLLPQAAKLHVYLLSLSEKYLGYILSCLAASCMFVILSLIITVTNNH